MKENDGASRADDGSAIHAERRQRRIFAAAGTALVGKGLMLMSNAAIVPLTVRYLGAEQFGLWITITSTMTMLVVLDLGIANTLTNLISEAYANRDRALAGHYFATAFWMVSGLALALAAAGYLAGGYVDWGSLFHVSNAAAGPALRESIGVAFGVFLLGLPLGLSQRILAGYQELHAANVISGGGAILSLGLVATGVRMQGTLPWLVAGFAAGPVLANLCSLGWICLRHKPWMMPWLSRVRRRHLGAIFHSGSRFFLIQLAGVIVFNSDNLVISHYLDPAQVTPYSVTWRLVGYGSSLQALLSPALWPAYAEAYARADMGWIRRTYRKMQGATVVLLSILAVVLFFAGKWIIHFWAGPAAVPSTLLLGLMCCWMVIYGITINQACLLGATNRVNVQAVASVLAAVANLALSIYLVVRMGLPGVILGSLLSYLLFVVFVQSMQVRGILHRSPTKGESCL